MEDIQATGIKAPNRQALVAILKQPIITNIYPLAAPVSPLRVVLPCCGSVREWLTPHDIPEDDVGPCPCGNWFIRYEEK